MGETPVTRMPLTTLALLAGLAACSDPARPQKTAETLAAPVKPVVAPTVVAPAPIALTEAPSLAAPDHPAAQAINGAVFGAEAVTAAPAAGASAKPAAPKAMADPVMIRAQVLLDRARFAPGVIDGRNGENVKQALAAFERAHQLPEDGKLDAEVWAALTADAGPVVVSYTLTAEDVAGPFLGTVPEGYDAQAKLSQLGYADVAEALGEKFHMDPKLLKALNPEADLSAVGTVILVAAARTGELPQVAAIEVDKAARAVRAYDASGKLLALYPASVGSTERPAPSGAWAVNTVAPAPVYYYDPSRLTFGRTEAKGRLKISAGPNNPVGSTWIDLTKDTYGIHGSPDPEVIGKRQSHGCVRLTNWDAAELGKAVKAGTKVTFVGEESLKKG